MAPLHALAFKEARALLPVWLASVLAALSATLITGRFHELSLFALAAATLALGANAVGHEYGHGTLGVMLTLPVARHRILLVKVAVLAPMVLLLAVYTWLQGLVADAPWLVWLAAAGALCLAPSLTMLCRSPLAGALLSVSLPATLMIAVLIATGAVADPSAEAERAATAIWLRLMVVLLAGSAVLGWRLFMRLEQIDGGRGEIHLGWRSRSSPATRPGPRLWQLVKKELHLQQLTFAITAVFFFTAWPSAAFFRFVQLRDEASSTGAAIYWLCLPVLAGSLACAEERRLGTLRWQLQLPTAAWQQWAAKVGTVFGVALLVSIVGPVLLVKLLWPAEQPAVGLAAALAILLTAISLYISSLCATGLRAAVASLTVVPLLLWLVAALVIRLSPTAAAPAFWSGREGTWLALLALIVVLLVGLAFVNHGPERPAAPRIWRQTLGLAACAGVGIVIVEAIRF